MAEGKTIDPHLVAEIVGRYVAHNIVAASDLSNLIATVHRSLAALGQPAEASGPLKPAVAINRSYGRDFVICLECGWRGKMLRRHLTAAHGLSPPDYRARWNLRDTHPLIAPAYSQRRSTLAKQLGLGQLRRTRPVAPEPRNAGQTPHGQLPNQFARRLVQQLHGVGDRPNPSPLRDRSASKIRRLPVHFP